MKEFGFHKFIAVGLAFMVLTYNFNTAIIVVKFMLNQDVIAKTLCVQKEEQKGCNGKCHLKKQLQQNNSQNDDKSPMQNAERFALNFDYIQPINQLEFGKIFKTIKSKPIVHKTNKVRMPSYDIETPPPNLSYTNSCLKLL